MGLASQIERVFRRGNGRLGRNLILVLLLVLATWASRQFSSVSVGSVEGRPRLVDGDSFFIGATEVRMQGIDAPEGRQTCFRDGRDWRCGEEAKCELERAVGSASIRCDVHAKDQHGRALATCTSATGQNLNQHMVQSGLAVAFGSYEAEEREARTARRGLWGSKFERPQDWRRRTNAGS